MKSLLLVLAVIAVGVSNGQISYDTASIPRELLENANAIKRYENIKFEVKDIDRAVYSVHRVYTVMNEQAASQLYFQEATEKFRKIDEFEVKGYNAAGIVQAKYKKKDLNRQAILDGVASDGNIYYMRLTPSNYPATIEYKYEIEFSGTAFYPGYLVTEPNESVENSSFTAIVPADLDLRYKARFTDIKPEVSIDKTTKTYKWSVKNLKATKVAQSQVTISAYPLILIAPNKFSFYRTEGDMRSWKSLGDWSYGLMNGLDVVPDERKTFYANMVKDAKTDREKVAILYNYLQKNFRYVSIQLGIGGWKPFPFKVTDEKQYGDCKALSFFMYSVLKSIGVKSYCALINSDEEKETTDPAFPANRFNHMILCVPQNTDTIWLECTSNTIEFGTLGSGTAGRYALLVTENGGILTRTSEGTAMNHSQASSTTIWLGADGSGKTQTRYITRGRYREEMDYLMSSKKDDQKHLLVNYFGIKQPDEFSLQEKKENEFLNVNMELSIEKIPQFMAGSKMFLVPRLNTLWKEKLPAIENRKDDYFFPYPMYKEDTTVYNLPEGYIAEVLPKPVTLKCEYAEYSNGYIYDAAQNKIISIARLKLSQNKIPAAQYADVKTFFDNVLSAENQKLVVKKN